MVSRYTIGAFATQIFVDARRRLRDAGSILRRALRYRFNVVPGAHRPALIDTHWSDRRVRKHRQAQLRYESYEVVAIGAQTMQPDHTGRGVAGAWR